MHPSTICQLTLGAAHDGVLVGLLGGAAGSVLHSDDPTSAAEQGMAWCIGTVPPRCDFFLLLLLLWFDDVVVVWFFCFRVDMTHVFLRVADLMSVSSSSSPSKMDQALLLSLSSVCAPKTEEKKEKAFRRHVPNPSYVYPRAPAL